MSTANDTPNDQTMDTLPDPDDAELQAARAAVEAETSGAAEPTGNEEGSQDAGNGAPDAGLQELQQQHAAEQDGQQDPAAPAPMIPKARLDEVLQKAQEARDAALYWKGVAEARAAAGQPQGQQPQQQAEQQPQAPDFEAQIKAERDKVLDAARRYDEGEITYSELKQSEIAAEDTIATLRKQAEQQHTASQKPAYDPSDPKNWALSDQQYLEQQERKLLAEHPNLGAMNETQVQALVRLAYQEAHAIGRPFGVGPAETARLREHIATLSDVYGPRWGVQVPTKPAIQGGQKPQQPQLSPQAQARVGKMALQTQLPPDTNGMGQGAAPNQQISDADIMRMSDEEIAALPPAMRNRLLGG